MTANDSLRDNFKNLQLLPFVYKMFDIATSLKPKAIKV